MSENTPAVAAGSQAHALSEQYPAWTPTQVALMHNTLLQGKGSSDEMALLLYQAQRTGLDPLAKQIYGIFRWDSALGREKMTIQVGIDGFRAIADDTGEMDGSETFWCGEDGVWKDVWTETGYPFAAKVLVYKKGCTHGFPGMAKWGEFVQTKKSGEVVRMWDKMPTTMLAKCAEAQALRKAHPKKLSGLYTDDEMGQANNNLDPSMSADRPAGEVQRQVDVQPKPNPNPKADAAVANAGKAPSGVQPRQRPVKQAIPPGALVNFKEATSAAKSACACACGKKMLKGQMLAVAQTGVDEQTKKPTHFLAHKDCYTAALDEKTNTVDGEYESVPERATHEDGSPVIPDRNKGESNADYAARVRAAVSETPAGALLGGEGEPDPMRDGKD